MGRDLGIKLQIYTGVGGTIQHHARLRNSGDGRHRRERRQCPRWRLHCNLQSLNRIFGMIKRRVKWATG